MTSELHAFEITIKTTKLGRLRIISNANHPYIHWSFFAILVQVPEVQAKCTYLLFVQLISNLLVLNSKY